MDPGATKPKPKYSPHPHRLQGFNYADPNYAYFVTICAREGSPFTDERLASEVVQYLEWLRKNRGLRIYAYCLMPNHLHLLVQPGDGELPLGGVVRAFKTWTTRQSWKLGYKGTLWQARFHDHIVRRSEDGEQIAAYILDNPVRKGLVTEVDAYRWSGMPGPL